MNDVVPEFSRPVAVERLKARETRMDIEADAAERRALAERFGLPSIESLTATVRLRLLDGGKLVRVSGEFAADVTQSCVVTLAPVPAHVAESFSLIYGPEEEAEGGGEVTLDLDVEDPPEPIVDGAIDVGEAVAEHLALSLDPFPRTPGASFEAPAEPPVEKAPNPFAALAALKDKKSGGQK